MVIMVGTGRSSRHFLLAVMSNLYFLMVLVKSCTIRGTAEEQMRAWPLLICFRDSSAGAFRPPEVALLGSLLFVRPAGSPAPPSPLPRRMAWRAVDFP